MEPNEDIRLCDYGCGRPATHPFKNGKWCCETVTQRCPTQRKEIASRASDQWDNYRKKYMKEHPGYQICPTCNKILKDWYSLGLHISHSPNHPNWIEYRNSLLPKPDVCEYGCGQPPKYQFKIGKWCCSDNYLKCPGVTNPLHTNSAIKNQKKSMETLYEEGSKHLERRREWMRNPEFRKKQSKNTTETWKDPEYREIQSAHSKRRMLNGHAIYMRQFISNPSKPQKELFKLCQELFPYPIIEYPCMWTNKSIDIVIPQFQVAIEYDGSWWHPDAEADRIRQELLEEQGWKFVRYRDYVPTKEELLADVLAVL